MAIFYSKKLLGIQKSIDLFWKSNDTSFKYSFYCQEILKYKKTNNSLKFKTLMRKKVESSKELGTDNIRTTSNEYTEQLIFDILSGKSNQMKDVYIEINDERFKVDDNIVFACEKG